MQNEDGDNGDDNDPGRPVDCRLKGRHEDEKEQA